MDLENLKNIKQSINKGSLQKKHIEQIRKTVEDNKNKSKGGLNVDQIKKYLKTFKIQYKTNDLREVLIKKLNKLYKDILTVKTFEELGKDINENIVTPCEEPRKDINENIVTPCEEPSKDINENIELYLNNSFTNYPVCKNDKNVEYRKDKNIHCCNSDKPPTKDDALEYIKYFKDIHSDIYEQNKDIFDAYEDLFNRDNWIINN